MFPQRYFPVKYFAPRYWPPGGVPVTLNVEEFFLQVQRVGAHNLQLAQILDRNVEIWTYAGFEFTFTQEDLTSVEVEKLREFYLSITQEEDIDLIMQRWYDLGLEIKQVDPAELEIQQLQADKLGIQQSQAAKLGIQKLQVIE